MIDLDKQEHNFQFMKRMMKNNIDPSTYYRSLKKGDTILQDI